MLIDNGTMDLVQKGFKTVYSDAFIAAPSKIDKIVMKVPSVGRDETYGWVGQFPQMREWLGPRIINNLQTSSFTITNKTFESTVAVKRDDNMDDRLGVFK
ncbi:MAG: Mu-like prophage major head subunit gpT family protein, partial [Deltaproteobacteria bacterium]